MFGAWEVDLFSKEIKYIGQQVSAEEIHEVGHGLWACIKPQAIKFL